MKSILATVIFILNTGAQAATITAPCEKENIVNGKINSVRFVPASNFGIVLLKLKTTSMPIAIQTHSATEGLQLAALLSADDMDRMHLNITSGDTEVYDANCVVKHYMLDFKTY
jgi:hypothetical protein